MHTHTMPMVFINLKEVFSIRRACNSKFPQWIIPIELASVVYH